MKKFVSFVVVLFMILVLPSAITPQYKGLKIGNQAPELVLPDMTLSVEGMDAQGYTLLHFWASYDAPSRIANIRYNDVIESLHGTPVRYVAVSYERNKELFQEIVRRDEVTLSNQYYDEAGEESELYVRYRLNKGFATYLIDASGTIVAHNPDKDTLAAILGK